MMYSWNTLVIILLPRLRTAIVYDEPFCFSPGIMQFQVILNNIYPVPGVTWNAPVSGGLPFIETSLECRVKPL